MGKKETLAKLAVEHDAITAKLKKALGVFDDLYGDPGAIFMPLDGWTKFDEVMDLIRADRLNTMQAFEAALTKNEDEDDRNPT